MSDQSRQEAVTIEEEEVQRADLLRTILRVGLLGSVAFLAVAVAGSFLLPAEYPSIFLILLACTFVAVAILSYLFLRRGLLYWAAAIYLSTTVAGLFLTSFFVGGVTGPLALALIPIPVMGALLAGRRAARWTAVGIAAIYAVLLFLEMFGVIWPFQIAELAQLWTWLIMFSASLTVTTFLVAEFSSVTRRALAAARGGEEELVKAAHEAQQAALADREAREREERSLDKVRQVVREYSLFLERVSGGEYDARLELEAIRAEGRPVRELLALGQQLNVTVDALVAVLADLQEVQRRYVREAWEGFSQKTATKSGFRYSSRSALSGQLQTFQAGQGASPALEETGVLPDEDAWLSPMTQAVAENSVAVDGQELAWPITLRGQVIGTMGARRDESLAWSEEDVALAESITDQLAQTIETLRLLDETQRSAARDRLLSEVTGRMRETLDVETVLQTAVQEMGDALRLHDLTIRLEMDGERAADRARSPAGQEVL